MSEPNSRFQVADAHKSLMPPEQRVALQEEVNVVNAWRNRVRAQRGWDPLNPPDHLFQEVADYAEALGALLGNVRDRADRDRIFKDLDCRTYDESLLLEKYQGLPALGAEGRELFLFTLSLIELQRLGDEAGGAMQQSTPEPTNHANQEESMTSEDELFYLAETAWDGPLAGELNRRFTEQFAQQLLGEDAVSRLRALYPALADRNPLSLLREHLRDSPIPPFSPSDPEFQARSLPPELRAMAVDFFRTVIDLVTRYAGEFIARNADIPASAPEHNRDYYFLNRTLDHVLSRLERHFNVPADQATGEFDVA